MSDGLPTEDQLRRMEQRVMTRIRRRAELPKRIAGGAAAAALVVGGVFLLPRLGLGVAASGGGSGGSAASGSGSLALVAYCHTSSSPASEFRSVPVGGERRLGAAAIEACVTAIRAGRVPSGARDSSGGDESSGDEGSLQRDVRASDLIACFDQRKRLQVFLKDAAPSTLCTRNGMNPAP